MTGFACAALCAAVLAQPGEASRPGDSLSVSNFTEQPITLLIRPSGRLRRWNEIVIPPRSERSVALISRDPFDIVLQGTGWQAGADRVSLRRRANIPPGETKVATIIFELEGLASDRVDPRTGRRTLRPPAENERRAVMMEMSMKDGRCRFGVSDEFVESLTMPLAGEAPHDPERPIMPRPRRPGMDGPS